jgi:AcrR family transcriptional regulator
VPFEKRRERDDAARHRLIVAAARRLAEADGWDAVTTRRLSTEIEFSQPVLYKHFSGMDAIAQAVAVEGFRELAEALRLARTGSGTPDTALIATGRAYLDFARANPAVYDAMFTRATSLRFAEADTPESLVAGFAELREGISAIAPHADADTLSEVYWAALHGLVTLARDGRLRAGLEVERLESLADQMTRLPGAHH